MYHLVEFVTDWWVDLELSPRQPLERVLLRRGARRRVQLRPHVIQSTAGLVEAADLYFEDGTTARDIPFASFAFAD